MEKKVLTVSQRKEGGMTVAIEVPQVEDVAETIQVCGGHKAACHLINRAIVQHYQNVARKMIAAGELPEAITEAIESGDHRPPGAMPKSDAEKQIEAINKMDEKERKEFEALLAAEIGKRNQK